MHDPARIPTGRETTFQTDEIIVSKTNLKGQITYANPVFCRVSGYTETELAGQPHNLIRHPDMPRGVFKLLWSTLEHDQEIFAYVLNLAKNGDGYWVFAHVTPSFDRAGQKVGYHSNRRVPYPDALAKVKGLYAATLAEERRHANPKQQAQAGLEFLVQQLGKAGMSYGEFVFSLSTHTCLESADV